MPSVIVLENSMITSEAFTAIKSANSMRVLLEFYRRRVYHKLKQKKATLMNNGQIVLPYKYAQQKMGIPQTTFSRCLDELVGLGFLDVEELSCGLHKMPTKWRLSGRWQRYGTPEFKYVKRPHVKPPHGIKGCKGEPFGAAVKKKPDTINGDENE